MKSKKLVSILFVSFFCLLSFYAQSLNSENVSESSSSNQEKIESQFKMDGELKNPEEQFKFSTNTNQNEPVRKTNGVWAFIRMILVLAVVIICIYFVMNFMKKSANGNSENDDIYLRKVAHVNLAPGKSVQIVTLLDNCYVVGVSDNNVNLLGTIDDKELIAAMNLSADKATKSKKAKNFSEILEMFMPSKSTKTTQATQNNIYSDSAQQVTDFVTAQRKRVNRTKKKE